MLSCMAGIYIYIYIYLFIYKHLSKYISDYTGDKNIEDGTLKLNMSQITRRNYFGRR